MCCFVCEKIYIPGALERSLMAKSNRKPKEEEVKDENDEVE